MATPLFITPERSYRLELASSWRSIRYAEAYQRLHPDAKTGLLAVTGGYAVFVAPQLPVNKAGAIGLTGPVPEEDIQAIEDFYQEHGVSPSLHVSPLADPSLFDCLQARGYRLDGFFSVLFRSIPVDFSPSELPAGLTITRAREEQAGLWIRVTGQGFTGQDDLETDPPAEAVDILGPNFYAEDGAAYFAWLDDPALGVQPAGGGGMYVHQGVVELGGASTRPLYRKRGIQRALIEARLYHARSLGCDLAVVLTEPGSDSQRNLERAGFSLAYTKVCLKR